MYMPMSHMQLHTQACAAHHRMAANPVGVATRKPFPMHALVLLLSPSPGIPCRLTQPASHMHVVCRRGLTHCMLSCTEHAARRRPSQACHDGTVPSLARHAHVHMKLFVCMPDDLI